MSNFGISSISSQNGREENISSVTEITCQPWLFEPRIKLKLANVVSKYSDISLELQQITGDCKLWFQSSYVVYVLAYQCTTGTYCLLQTVASKGTFCMCFRFLYIVYVQPLPCGRDTVVMYEKWISWALQADELV